MPWKLGTSEARFGLLTGSDGSYLVSKCFTKDPSSPCPPTRRVLGPSKGAFSCILDLLVGSEGFREHVRKCWKTWLRTVSGALTETDPPSLVDFLGFSTSRTSRT